MHERSWGVIHAPMGFASFRAKAAELRCVYSLAERRQAGTARRRSDPTASIPSSVRAGWDAKPFSVSEPATLHRRLHGGSRSVWSGLALTARIRVRELPFVPLNHASCFMPR